MAAYLVGQIRVKDPDRWQHYVAGVGQSLAPFDAEVVFRGHSVAVLVGEQPRDQVVVIRFRDQESLREWFESPAYQTLVLVRDAAADVVITAYSED